MTESPETDILCTTVNDGQIAVARLCGRGSMLNAPTLRSFSAHVQDRCPEARFIIDISKADLLDSTFLGVIGEIALNQMQAKAGKTVLLNAADNVRRILKTLGLIHVVELRDCGSDAVSSDTIDKASGSFERVCAEPMSRVERICLMLRAHQNLVQIDESNKVEFQPVIQYLEESLAKESRNGS